MPNPLVALSIGVFVLLTSGALFWPERGIVASWRKNRRMTTRILGEDALKYIHKSELQGRRPTVEGIAGSLHISTNETADLLASLQAQNLLKIEDGEIHLTPQGRDSALHIIRAHRLWERYLADETGFTEADWHGQADQFEHHLTEAQLDALEAMLNYPTHDPHGDPIPSARGELKSHGGKPLTSLTIDQPGQIVHLEDEPPIVYAQLVAEGLHVGMTVRITEMNSERVRFWTNGDEHVLAPIVASNISVVPVPTVEVVTPSGSGCGCLADVAPGDEVEVVSISPICRGAERRRFLDLGVLPGTVIRAEMKSPGGDPTAYRIRGALIALRRQQAEYIKVKTIEPVESLA